MKKTLKNILIGLLSAVVGFCLMEIPFHIFELITPVQSKLIFVTEIIVYFIIFAIAAIIFEMKKDKKRKNDEHAKRHKERVEKRKRELNGIKIDIDLAA